MNDKKLNIPPPDGSKRPMKANVFRHAAIANSQLTPLFPFLDAGAIVPCSAAFRSDGVSYGTFHHTNSEDEEVIVWGSNNPHDRTGTVFVGAREHHVKGPPAERPQAFMVVSVTQRQSEEGVQEETVAFFCESCHEKLHSHTFDASAPHVVNGSLPILPTTAGTLAAAKGFAGGACPKCGHMNERFPDERWGWETQVRRFEICGNALSAYKDEIARN